MADGYVRQRVYYGNLGGGLEVKPTTMGQTLVSPRSQSQLFIQRINVVVSKLATGTWDVQDSISGVSLLPGGPVSVAASTNISADFGANGVALTPLAGMVFVNNGEGATGAITWDAYSKLRTDVPVTL